MLFTVSLKDNYMFKRLYKSKKCAVCPCFVIYCSKNNLGYNRLGITTGRKLGKAVVRNRVRRRLKEAYRLNESHISRSLDIVLVARSKGIYAPFSLICKELLKGYEDLCIKA